MYFVSDYVCQRAKSGYLVCGDTCKCERTYEGTTHILCDGIGSGVYANIAAETCAERIKEALRLGAPLRSVCETVAASMHRARTESIPFSAFSAAFIRPDGHFTVYAYEAPAPLVIKNGTAKVLTPSYYTYGYEVVGEYREKLKKGDSLILMSDGVTQSGLGGSYAIGVGSSGIADYYNRKLRFIENAALLPDKIVDYCLSLGGGRYEDDTTLALLCLEEAKELTVFTGPPSKKSMDKDYAAALKAAEGKKIVCGSSTVDIISRELGLTVVPLNISSNFSEPPEYFIEGVDLCTEGAVTLNQVYNMLDEKLEDLPGNSSVKRMCVMLKEANVIHFHVGNALNTAHEDALFKQVGVKVRKTTIKMLSEKLKSLGKLVTEKHY